MSSGATTSAGRAKKDGGRWERVVAMGVAWGWVEAIGRRVFEGKCDIRELQPF